MLNAKDCILRIRADNLCEYEACYLPLAIDAIVVGLGLGPLRLHEEEPDVVSNKEAERERNQDCFYCLVLAVHGSALLRHQSFPL